MKEATTLADVFHNRIAKTPDLVAMRAKDNGAWKATTFREFDRQAREVGNGLISLGVAPGSCVAILSSNRPEWLISDAGIILAGAVSTPVYVTNSPSQVAYVVGHSDATIAIVENQDQFDKILKTREELPKLQKVVVISGEGADEADLAISFEELKRLGREYEKANPSALDDRSNAIKAEDLATLVYTSGTTGPPKGSMLSHSNFTWTANALGKLLPLKEGDRYVSYLPLSHIFERLTGCWGAVHLGFDVWYAPSLEQLLPTLQEAKPNFFIGVPRVFEKFFMGMKAKIAAHEKKDLIEKAVKLGVEKFEAKQAGKSLGFVKNAEHALLDKLALSKLRDGIGMGSLRFAITGAAPISVDIVKFMHGIGLELVEGYGQTENNAPATITPPGKVRLGTVGPALPGLEIKFDEDGEILVKGPNVFMGYFKDPKATADTMTSDGFLRTGDVGELDSAGYLKITDRKKDLIITAGGKNIAPQVLEGALKFAPLISQAVVIGDRRPFLTALLTLDPEVAPKWAKDQGIEFDDITQLADDPKILAAVQGVVDKVNENLSQVEKIKKWTVLPRDFTQDAEEITPTMKVRRKAIVEKYGDTIERMYA